VLKLLANKTRWGEGEKEKWRKEEKKSKKRQSNSIKVGNV
jgi:hypothetical protein